MASLKKIAIPLLLCVTLGLAPFFPEPHLVGKLRWLMGGGEGMKTMDILDIFIHGAPWLWLVYTSVTLLKFKKKAA